MCQKRPTKRRGKLFIREAAHWSTLKHENIVHLYDFNTYPVPYLEAALCDGQLGGARLEVPRAVSVVLDVARGIRPFRSGELN
jgi:eukaryotic-like serine/threonine-protein kinase